MKMPVPLAPPSPPTARKGRADRDMVDGTAEYRLVPLDDLHDDPDQPRKTYRNIMELATNIKKVGLTQPIVARISEGGALTIMYGHRRKRALKMNGEQYAPTIIKYGVKTSEVLAAQISENSMRDQLDPIEEARGIRAFMRLHKLSTYLQAAEALGHSVGWVTMRVALLDLDEDDQKAVQEKKIGIVEAARIARKQAGNTRVSRQQAERGQGEQSPQTIRRPAAHFSDEHELAGRARSRCRVHDFPKPLIGGVACGACWEIVIRLDAARNPLKISGVQPVAEEI